MRRVIFCLTVVCVLAAVFIAVYRPWDCWEQGGQANMTSLTLDCPTEAEATRIASQIRSPAIPAEISSAANRGSAQNAFAPQDISLIAVSNGKMVIVDLSFKPWCPKRFSFSRMGRVADQQDIWKADPNRRLIAAAKAKLGSIIEEDHGGVRCRPKLESVWQ